MAIFFIKKDNFFQLYLDPNLDSLECWIRIQYIQIHNTVEKMLINSRMTSRMRVLKFCDKNSSYRAKPVLRIRIQFGRAKWFPREGSTDIIFVGLDAYSQSVS
jgi:hypothetical protein